jgi:hypothetical protein
MSVSMSAADVFGREFLGIRHGLIELAAALDRIDRAGGVAADDPRWLQIRRSLDILAGSAAGRAEGVEILFSLPYPEKAAGK